MEAGALGQGQLTWGYSGAWLGDLTGVGVSQVCATGVGVQVRAGHSLPGSSVCLLWGTGVPSTALGVQPHSVLGPPARWMHQGSTCPPGSRCGQTQVSHGCRSEPAGNDPGALLQQCHLEHSGQRAGSWTHSLGWGSDPQLGSSTNPHCELGSHSSCEDPGHPGCQHSLATAGGAQPAAWPPREEPV